MLKARRRVSLNKFQRFNIVAKKTESVRMSKTGIMGDLGGIFWSCKDRCVTY